MADPAIDSLRAALAIAPDDAALHRLLADRLAGRGEFDPAIEEYRSAVRLLPHDQALRMSLAAAFLATGRYAAAELVADELLREDPTFWAALLLRARALHGQERPAEARTAYETAIAKDGSLSDERLAIELGFLTTEASSGALEKPAVSESVAAEPMAPPEALVGDGEPTRQADTSSRFLTTDGVDVERPRIAFADVGGMEDLKEQIRLKILYPRQHPEIYRAYGQRAGGGILLYGPPGCGKTHLARATAGELDSTFISVGIADVLEMWIGSSERNLHNIFAVARAHSPCVLFFDEIDALAASRADFKSTAGRHLINQFLSELDGQDSNEGLLVMGATNAPWHMDTAFRRPGRFDQIVFVPPPDLEARAQILRVLLRDRPAGGVDVRQVASKTDGYSGADLAAIIEQAIERKLAQALRDGLPRPITTDDLTAAARSVRPSTGEWFGTVRNYVLYANEAGLYDPVRPYLKR